MRREGRCSLSLFRAVGVVCCFSYVFVVDVLMLSLVVNLSLSLAVPNPMQRGCGTAFECQLEQRTNQPTMWHPANEGQPVAG